jgi:xanthine dehydrogenase YagT iron-sulfur-binding subunit
MKTDASRTVTLVGFAKPVVEREVTLTVDGHERTATAWSDLSALLFIRLTLRHPTPRRGCEAGTCGSCESMVNGTVTRLCQTLSTDLDGATVLTTPPC